MGEQRLRAVQRLNLRLLVNAEHYSVVSVDSVVSVVSVVRRRHVQADDIAHFLDELGVL